MVCVCICVEGCVHVDCMCAMAYVCSSEDSVELILLFYLYMGSGIKLSSQQANAFTH